jgi:hypothetical protein
MAQVSATRESKNGTELIFMAQMFLIYDLTWAGFKLPE